ncbi:MAG: hypothetical protein H6R37_617 [Deltaproteobacteria bacterium]|jgi:hypothetical protein|nr:hypothetical protein [Deltaproteobacteria bacterium]
MDFYDLSKGTDFCVSNKKTPKDEWTKIIDRVEAALLVSLANKVLGEAIDKQDQIEERRKQLKLVELATFVRKDSTG